MIRIQLYCFGCAQFLDTTVAPRVASNMLTAFNASHLHPVCQEESPDGRKEEGKPTAGASDPGVGEEGAVGGKTTREAEARKH